MVVCTLEIGASDVRSGIEPALSKFFGISLTCLEDFRGRSGHRCGPCERLLRQQARKSLGTFPTVFSLLLFKQLFCRFQGISCQLAVHSTVLTYSSEIAGDLFPVGIS
jgi:hypothetical protein